jgi:hypothetical protein
MFYFVIWPLSVTLTFTTDTCIVLMTLPLTMENICSELLNPFMHVEVTHWTVLCDQGRHGFYMRHTTPSWWAIVLNHLVVLQRNGRIKTRRTDWTLRQKWWLSQTHPKQAWQKWWQLIRNSIIWPWRLRSF